MCHMVSVYGCAILIGERGRMMQSSGTLTLADDEQVVLAEALGTFMALTSAMIETLMKDYPQMRTFFDHAD